MLHNLPQILRFSKISTYNIGAKDYYETRGVSRALSNIYDRFFCDNSFIIDVWEVPKYAFEKD